MNDRRANGNSPFYVVGAQMDPLTAAAALIRDGGVNSHNIITLEESSRKGGSLDADSCGEATEAGPT